MAEKMKLSWHAHSKGWRKYRKGKMYYVGPRPIAKTDKLAKEYAWRCWLALEAELQAQESPSVVTALKQFHTQKARDEAAERYFQDKSATQGDIHPSLSSQEILARMSPDTLADATTELRVAGLKSAQPSNGEAGKPETIEALIDLYLSQKRQDAELGDISSEMFAEHKRNLGFFAEWAKQTGRIQLAELNAPVLGEYSAFVQALKNPETAANCQTPAIGPVTIKKRLGRLAQFCRWAYEQEYLDKLPRNVIRGFGKVKLPRPEPRHFTAEEIRELFSLASERTRLFIGLGLNLAATQMDISTLEHEHIDWQSGRVKRCRHKTGIPTEFQLWPVTLALLRKYATAGQTGLVLLGENGKPLLHSTIRPNGAPAKVDAIRLAWDRLRDKQNRLALEQAAPALFARVKGGAERSRERKRRISQALIAERRKDNRGFSCLRKTAAQAVFEQFGTDTRNLFLGHAVSGVAKHYVNGHFEGVFQACEYLDKQVFRLGELTDR